MSATNTMSNNTQTIWEMIDNSSFWNFTKDLLKQLTEQRSLDMNSAKALMRIIKDNNLNESDVIIDITKSISRINERGILLTSRLNDVLTYFHSFIPNQEWLNEVIELRKKTLDNILSKPTSTV